MVQQPDHCHKMSTKISVLDMKNFNKKNNFFVTVLAWGSPLIALTWLQIIKIPTNDPTNMKIFFKISKNENKLFFSEFFDLAFFFSFFAIFKIQYAMFGRGKMMGGGGGPNFNPFSSPKKGKIIFILSFY